MDSYGLYLSRVFLEFPPKPVYFTMIAEKFQIYSVKITANTFVSQKIASVQFYSCLQAKLFPRFFHYPPGRQELPIPPEQGFLKIFFFLRRKGHGVEKITKINKCIGHKF